MIVSSSFPFKEGIQFWILKDPTDEILEILKETGYFKDTENLKAEFVKTVRLLKRFMILIWVPIRMSKKALGVS